MDLASTSRRRLFGLVILALVLLVVGTAGYVLIEKWSLTDAWIRHAGKPFKPWWNVLAGMCI